MWSRSERNFFLKFHPNLLYSVRAPSKFEFEFVRVVFGVVKKFYPGLGSRLRQVGAGGVRLVCHSSAQLRNESWVEDNQALVHLDLEFIRLLERVSRAFTALFNLEQPLEHSREMITDRMLFHAGIYTGSYDLLPLLPVGVELPALELDYAEWTMYQACFVAAHELHHLDLSGDDAGLRTFAREVATLAEGIAPLSPLLPLQPDYAHLLATFLLGEEGTPGVYALSNVLSIDDRELAEMRCDIAAFGVTATHFAGSLETEGNKAVWHAVVALFGLQCCLLLLGIANEVVRAIERPRREVQAARLHEASLRTFVLTMFIARWILASVVPALQHHYLQELERLVRLRNAFVRDCAEMMCARAAGLPAGTPSPEAHEVRRIAEAWGYRADRFSKLLWPVNARPPALTGSGAG